MTGTVTPEQIERIRVRFERHNQMQFHGIGGHNITQYQDDRMVLAGNVEVLLQALKDKHDEIAAKNARIAELEAAETRRATLTPEMIEAGTKGASLDELEAGMKALREGAWESSSVIVDILRAMEAARPKTETEEG